MKNMIRKIFIIILSLVVLSLIISIWLPIEKSFRIVFGSVYILFLPGYILSLVIFRKLDILERIALSFALSISIVPLLVFYFNLAGLDITLLNISLIVLAIIVIGLFFVFKNVKIKK